MKKGIVMKKVSILIVCILNISLLCMENSVVIDLLSETNFPLMQTLYNETYSFLKDEMDDQHLITPMRCNNKDIIQKNIELASLIKTINNAKETITEDAMAQFSYNIIQGINGNGNQLRVPLFFSCLKRYNLAAQQNQESLPDVSRLKGSFLYQELSQKLKITELTNSKPKQEFDTGSPVTALLKEYPTYFTFVKNITKLIHMPSKNIDKNFLMCLYTDKMPLQDDYYNGYKNVTHDFYTQMHAILHDKMMDIYNPANCVMDMLDMLHFIAHAKESGDITDEKQLGQDIINFQLPQSNIDPILNFFRPNSYHVDIANTKKRISAFCLFLNKYNNLRKDKSTPYLLQHIYYQIKNDLQLALPDNYNNCAFDESKYAFKELNGLINDFQMLVLADDESIKKLVDEYYCWSK